MHTCGRSLGRKNQMVYQFILSGDFVRVANDIFYLHEAKESV